MMQKVVLYALILAWVGFTGCTRSAGEVWDDTKTAGRYMGRGLSSLAGKRNVSREICSADEFSSIEHSWRMCDPAVEFSPLADQGTGEAGLSLFMAPPPQHEPGEQGSTVPGIEAFRDAKSDPELGRILQPVHFAYDSSQIKGEENVWIVLAIADYLRGHPKTYLFIEGHCDERGPQAYNLALGSRRAHSVRNTLIKEGASPDQLFTISYGKERPCCDRHDETAWTMNRRAEFKVYSGAR